MPPVDYAPGNTPPPIVEDYGFPGHLTVLQAERLEEFRNALVNYNGTKDSLAKAKDIQLLRYLRAREFNVKKAMKMIVDDVEWRQAMAGRKLSIQNFPTLLGFVKNRLVRLGGKDKSGRPFLILRSGEMFPRKVADVMEVVNFFIYYVEFLLKYVHSLGFAEFVAIADMSKWSLSDNFSLPISQLLAQILQDHFAESLRYAFVVNNPFAFSAAWSLISPFLEDRVKAKVHVWGKRTEKLLNYIDADQLEEEFGGTRKPYDCPDELVQPLLQNKVAVIGDPYVYISWTDDEKVTSVASPDVGIPIAKVTSANAGEEGFSDYEEDDQEAAPVSQVSALNLSATPTNQKLEKKKRGGFRRAIGRMFSMKSKKSSQFEDSEDIPSPAMPGSPVGKEARPLEIIPQKPRPRVAVFGATGKLGKLLVLELLKEGNDVTAFVRVNGSNLSSELVKRAETSNDAKTPRLNIVVGDTANLLDLERVVEDCDAVICAMGVVPAVTGTSCEFLPRAISHIMDAMEKMKVRRLVVVSSAHASQGWWELGAGLVSNLTKPIYWKNHYQYVAQMEDEIKSRGIKGAIDFTIARPGTLTDGPSAGIRCEEGFVFPDTGPGEIARADLVKFLMSEALDLKATSKYCGKGVAVGKC